MPPPPLTLEDPPLHPIDYLRGHARAQPGAILFRQPFEERVENISYAAAADTVARLAGFLRAQGIRPGDKVAIISKNCAHWELADFAIFWLGAVSVPLYPTLPPAEMQAILEHADVKFICLGKLDNFGGIHAALPTKYPRLIFPFESMVPAPGVFPWATALQSAPVEPQLGGLDSVATIIYTSGTTGEPKGVMHSFRAMVHAAIGFSEDAGLTSDDIYFSYLPLAHVAERTLTEMIVLASGAEVTFVHSIDSFAADLARTRPTVFLAVPRIWEKMLGGVFAKLPEKKLRVLLAIPIVKGLIGRKIRRALGLDRLKIAFTGAAASRPEIFDWFDRMGIFIANYYGMTENFCYSHRLAKGPRRRVSVGTPMPGVEVRFGPDGELQVKSPTLMLGYYKDDAATKRALPDGYLSTGDVGELDAEGNLLIVGRTKEIFKTKKAKYVAPEKLEKLLDLKAYCEVFCVVGDGLNQPALIANLSPAKKDAPRAQIEAYLAGAVRAVNAEVAPHERIDHVLVVAEPWTVDNGLMTPTLKLKRPRIEKRYASAIQNIESDAGKVRWAL